MEAFGESLLKSQPPAEPLADPPAPSPSPSRRGAPRPEFPGRRRVWVEARDYPEALALSREWREPLLIALTQENYALFLKDHRRWEARRLIWRLPPECIGG